MTGRVAIGKDGLVGFLDKAKGLLSQNADKIEQSMEQAVDKAGDLVASKTKGKYADTIDRVQDAAKKALTDRAQSDQQK